MGDKSKIEWTDASWNPVVGCKPKAAGCRHCYASEFTASRLGLNPKTPHYHGLVKGSTWNGEIGIAPDKTMTQPDRWRKPRKVFVCSMGDLFYSGVPDALIDAVFGVMARNPRHRFQVLTKRPERMADFAIRWSTAFDMSHVWYGASASNQDDLNRVGRALLNVRGNRFLSLEPLLDQVNLRCVVTSNGIYDLLRDTGKYGDSIGWVIVGCESGPHRRRMALTWVASVRDECAAARTPLFIKQMEIDGKIAKMPEIGGVVYDQVPAGLREVA